MTTLDAGIIIITLFFLVRGIWIGFTRQVASLAALAIGYVAAGHYYNHFSGYLAKFISEPQLAFIITYALVFVVTYVLVILLGIVGKKVMQISFLGWFDKLLGGIFGLAKAVFINTLLFMLLAWILSSSNPLIQKSFLSKYLMISSKYVTAVIQDKELRDKIMPQKPAISAFLGNPVKFFQNGNGKTK
jgi:membrane protein required for colicin V production